MKCANMIFLDPFTSYPCGVCYICRVKKTREWQTRLLQENDYWDSSLFVTLTYDDDHVPEELIPRDLINWIKSYRKRIAKDGRTCKYYAVGEYGDNEMFTYRPHYHLIIFGAVLSDFAPHKYIHGKYSHLSWDKGFIDIGTVTAESIGYVTGYVRKKLSKRQEKGGGRLKGDTDPQVSQIIDNNIYINAGIKPSGGGLRREPPFQRQSQGLGLRWAEANRNYLVDNQVITVGGIKRSIPRYYVRKLGLELEDRSEVLEQDWNDAWERYWTKRKVFDASKRAELYAKALKQGEENLRAKFNLKRAKSV